MIMARNGQIRPQTGHDHGSCPKCPNPNRDITVPHLDAGKQPDPMLWRRPSWPATGATRTQSGQGSRASSLAATSVRSSPTTSGAANGAPNPPDLRLTQPVVSPARLAPWQSQSCAATSAIRSVATSMTEAAHWYPTPAGFHRYTTSTEITRPTSDPSPARLRNDEVRCADPLVRHATRTPASVSRVTAGSASGKAGSSPKPAMTAATCSSLTV